MLTTAGQAAKVVKMPKSRWHREFGARLRHARKVGGYDSCAAFAKTLSIHINERVSGQAIANYERGDRDIPNDLIPIIADLLHLPLDYWFEGSAGKAPASPGASMRMRRAGRS